MDQNGDSFNMEDYYEFLDGLYPLTNDVDLCMVESQIQTDKTYQKIMIHELSELRGGPLETALQRIMMKLFDDGFLRTYTYHNARVAAIKRNFYELNINELVFETLLSYPGYECADIRRTLKAYICQAGYRFNNPTPK